MDLQTLSLDEVLSIHEALVADFARTPDPIVPPGVRTLALLESAVSRQHTSLGTRLKYPTSISNAATLLYGICCDHPFHNGNKRTAMVAMLVHLDKNKLSLFQTRQADLYSLMMGVATHTVGLRPDPRRPDKAASGRKMDEEVRAIAEWIWKRAESVVRGERAITYRELRAILTRFGYYLEHPDKNSIDIVKHQQVTIGLRGRRKRDVPKRIGNIPYPGDGKTASVGILKSVRSICHLTEADGVDSFAFYDQGLIIDSFVNKYRSVLRRLAKR
jgi:death-on-curing protein